MVLEKQDHSASVGLVPAKVLLIVHGMAEHHQGHRGYFVDGDRSSFQVPVTYPLSASRLQPPLLAIVQNELSLPCQPAERLRWAGAEQATGDLQSTRRGTAPPIPKAWFLQS